MKSQEEKHNSFPKLRKLAEAHGQYGLVKLYDALECECAGSAKYNRIVRKLQRKRCMLCCENMWRDIFDRLKASQEGYPTRVESILGESADLMRKKIEELMHSHGYKGTYPDFVKREDISGVHLADAYGQSYFVVNEKNAVCRVYCFEDVQDGNISIDFVCATVILKRNEAVKDIYSCMFNGKGKRFFRLLYGFWFNNENGRNEPEFTEENVSERVGIAVKKAELRKLSKAEKKLYSDNVPVAKLSFLIAFAAGGIFAILMTAAVILLGSIVFLIAGQPELIPTIFTEFELPSVFAFCWIGFALPLAGAMFFLSNKKEK